MDKGQHLNRTRDATGRPLEGDVNLCDPLVNADDVWAAVVVVCGLSPVS